MEFIGSVIRSIDANVMAVVAAAIAAIADRIPVLRPLLPPGERPAAGGAGLRRQVPLLDASHVGWTSLGSESPGWPIIQNAVTMPPNFWTDGGDEKAGSGEGRPHRCRS